MPENQFAVAARNKKAAALVAVLQRIGITSRIAETADESEWAVVAREAGVLQPSAETIALVLQLLAEKPEPEPITAQQEYDDAVAAEQQAEAKREEMEYYEDPAARCPPRE